MRLLVVALICLIPVTAALPVHDDAAGDVEVRVAEQTSLYDPTGRFDPIDLLALSIEETPLDVRFRLDVNALAQDGVTFLDDSVTWIVFSHGEEQYGLRIRRAVEVAGPPQFEVALHSIDPATDLAGHPSLVDHDVSESSISITVPRKLIPDGTGAPPRPGTALTDLEVLSFGFGTLYLSNGDGVHRRGDEAVIRTLDRMPDEGPGGAFPFTVGVQQEGDLELRSLAPVRLSNGGSGLFIFEVQAANHGDEPMAADLAVDGVPDGWGIRLPFESALIRPDGVRSLPVLARVQSAHQHGGLDTFTLELGAGAGHVGRVELGIQYTAIPQPAGHHERLWLHTYERPPFVLGAAFEVASDSDVFHSLYMNTLEEDPADAGQPVEGQGIAVPGGRSEFGWRVPLLPQLGMGLHFDASDTGEITVPVEYDYLGEGLQLSGRIVVVQDGQNETVAHLRPADARDVAAGRVELTAAIDVADGVERVPFAPGQQLEMVLHVTGTFTGPTVFTPNYQPRIAPGAWLRLPLLEYQDAPDAFTDDFSGLTVELAASHRDGNPGDIIVVDADVENRLAEDVDAEVLVEGLHADWAGLDRTTLRLEGGGSETVRIRVDIPDDAPVGAFADLAITVRDPDDPFRSALARLTVDVVDAPVRDDADTLDAWGGSDKQSPAPAWILAVLAAALLRRRR